MEADLKALVLGWVRGWVKAGGRTFRKLVPCTVKAGNGKGKVFSVPCGNTPRKQCSQESRLARGKPWRVSLRRPCLPQDELLACKGVLCQTVQGPGEAGGRALSS